MKILIITILFISTSYAEVLRKNANGDFTLIKNSFTARELLADYARLEKLNLNTTSDFEDQTFTTLGKLEIPKSQIDSYVSSIMNQSGNAIIKSNTSSQVQVIRGSETRYSTLPIYIDLSKVPDSDDIIQFNYTIKNIEAAELSRNMRPFLSRFGRVIDMKSANTIHFTDTARNIIRMIKIVHFLDTEETAKSQKEVNELNEKHKKALAKQKSWQEVLVKENIIFITAFLLIGLILGFGVRGYTMKKIEGGW